MGFFDKVKNAFGFDNNFKYLDKSIHSGAKEIVLGSDIILGINEINEYENGIELDVDDLVIDGNGHMIDAQGKARIFYCTGKNITIKNITLKNGFTEGSGGAIYNSAGELTITESAFNSNAAEYDGGAIKNWNGELTIMESSFNCNAAEYDGGAIYNDARLSIAQSAFANNASQKEGRAIHNTRGSELKLRETEFDNDGIFNEGNLLVKGKFHSNQSKTISNDGNAVIESEDVSDKIENNGRIRKLKLTDGNQRDFTYLNELIHAGIDEIRLEYDVVLNVVKDEDETFYEGIEIDGNGLVIDGNGHAVDAQGLARAFHCTGNNITIKNIILKNGCARFGGAIKNSGELTITGSTLNNNTAQDYGGAIHNMGKLTIAESSLQENMAKEDGGAIRNMGELTIAGSKLSENTAQNGQGGAISNNENGELALSDSAFTGNAARYGGAICNKEGSSTIAGSKFTENTAQNGSGGAVYNSDGSLTIAGSKFTENTAEYNGGAVSNNDNGVLTITGSTLTRNVAKDNGGAIYNSGPELTISESSINNNAVRGTGMYSGGGAIYNKRGDFKIFNCEYSSNRSPSNIIVNNDSLQIHNTLFKENQSEYVVLNEGDESNLGIFNGDFIENSVEESVIYNDGKFCSVEKTAFQNNVSGNALNIINNSELTLTGPKISDKGVSILNHKYMLIRKSSPELESMIRGNGTVEIDETIIPKEEEFDFGYLDRKIHESNTREIILDHDITFANYERDFYEGGIELDMDNLIIDGNGKTIDGRDKSRIFIISAKNVTLKNIIFKNGRSHKSYDNPLNNNGGAIKINHDLNLTIEDCEFSNNISEDMGGGIINYGDLTVIQCSFSDNKSNNNGGAIFNVGGKITLRESALTKNMAEDSGGAIYNVNGELTIAESTFNNNTAEGAEMHSGGGAIYNLDGFLTITESALTKNTANTLRGGGAIYNGGGESTITGSALNNNSTVNFGGAIYNTNGKDRRGLLTMTECTLDNNRTGGSGGAIRNDSWLTIAGSTLTGNMAGAFGGAIFNSGNRDECLKGWDKICTDSVLTITESTLTENTADRGGAIWTNYKLHPDSGNFTFKDNKPDDLHENF